MSHISRLFWHTICFPSSYHHFTFFSKNTPKSSLEIIHIFRYQSHICSTPSSPPFSVCTFLISFVPQLYQSSSKLQRKVLYDITFTEGVNISPQRPDSEPFFVKHENKTFALSLLHFVHLLPSPSVFSPFLLQLYIDSVCSRDRGLRMFRRRSAFRRFAANHFFTVGDSQFGAVILSLTVWQFIFCGSSCF